MNKILNWRYFYSRYSFIGINFLCAFLCSFSLHARQDIKVQRGVAVIPAGSTTITLTAPTDFTTVSTLSNAFVRITNSQHTGAGKSGGGLKERAKDVTADIYFSAVDQIQIHRFGTNYDTRVCWEIIEYVGPPGGVNEFKVLAQGTTAFSASSLIYSLSFSGASTQGNLAGFICGVANPDTGRNDYETGLVTASFPDASTLQLERGSSGNDAVEVSYAVIDFTGVNWSVQRIEHQYQYNNGTVETESVNVPDISKAFIHAQKRNVGDLKGLDEFGQQVWLSASNELSFVLRAGATNPADQYAVVWIISNPDIHVSRGNGALLKNAGSEPDVENIDIPLQKRISSASLFINNTCSGPGTFYPRPILGARMISADQMELWRSDNGQRQDYRYEVVQWPLYAESTIEGTIYTDDAMTLPIVAGKKVSVSINGNPPDSVLTSSGGTFSIELYEPVSDGDVVLVYLDDEPEKASAVIVMDGSTELTGSNALKMVTESVMLQNLSSSSVTNLLLDIIDGVDADDDDGLTISGGSANFATGRKVWIVSGSTYNPGGNVSFGSLENRGTLVGSGNSFIVSGNWSSNGGVYNANNATVSFTGNGTSNISGDSTFDNFYCLEPSKTLVFEQGSTQTVNGKFFIDGSDFLSRIKLISSGGNGTTWNLVLNGTYDCRYVNVQGSLASGTAFLPLNPVGFKDSGDNTNWYDAALPTEMLFYDNFETSTLSSAPPDKTSSHWSYSDASWFTQPSTVVNNKNHTPGGGQSMYSAGGPSGEGIGAWSSPAWGPQTNCTAEAWFYDDMQNPKKQWLFIDNAAGNQGLGVLVESDQGNGAVKYRYCTYVNGSISFYDSYIDRSEGWHKVRWVQTDGTVDLYLDGALLIEISGLSDFSSFDTGSWSWHNNVNNTSMWFDDFMVYRSQHQASFRWYDNDNAENPTALDQANTGITRDTGLVTRLRLQIQNDQFEAWSGERIALQYKAGQGGTWTMLGASAEWSYADGLGTDQSQVANSLLTNTDVKEFFVESSPSAQVHTLPSGQKGEWDFTIKSNTSATVGLIYYFRPVIVDASGNMKRELASYDSLAPIELTSPNMKVWRGVISTSWNNPGNWSPQGVPVATDDVMIPSGTANDCHLDISGAVANSVYVRDGAVFYLDNPSTDLTVNADFSVEGDVEHASDSAVLNIHSGILRIDGQNAVYNHSGNGNINAQNSDLIVLNGGIYNISGSPSITLNSLDIASGGFVNVSGPAVISLNSMDIAVNAQWQSSNTLNIINLSGNFTNDGSMLGSTGGVFNFNTSGSEMGGSSTTTTFYQANFNALVTITTPNNITVLNDLVIPTTGSLTASTGKILVGGDWSANGAFIHGNGTVELNGRSLQNINTGGSEFYNLLVSNVSPDGVSFLDAFSTLTLTDTTPGSKMTFNAGSTYTVTGLGGLQLAGASGNEIKIVSSSPGTYWEIDPTGGGWSIDGVDVADSVNLMNEPVYPTNSIDSGHNINWFSLDRDHDELPDIWEYGYYRTLPDPLVNTAASDTDSDGISSIEEYVLSTDPTIPNVGTSQILYVDCHAGYIGDGSNTAPFKYLQDALDSAQDGTLISLAPGIYELDDYLLAKQIEIRGEQGPFKTIIRGASPDGATSDSGQILNISSKNFMISGVTLRLFRDDKPIISYDGNNVSKVLIFNNIIFRDNSTGVHSLIAPLANDNPNDIYMVNCLFYNNDALSGAELAGKKNTKIFNNTLVSNSFSTSLILSGKARGTYVTNNILRNGNSNEITDNTSGTGSIKVENCNIEDLANVSYQNLSCYDSTETFADNSRGFFQLLPGSPGIDAGTETALDWDINNHLRPQGITFDVGAFELDPDDSDSDGLTDTVENNNGYDALNPDSDNDGLTDGEEINVYATDPMNDNSDGDDIIDGLEPAMGMDPAVADGNGDIYGVYMTSFEDQGYNLFPLGSISDTIWGPNGNPNSSLVVKGDVNVVEVGAASAYDGVRIGRMTGGIPESSIVGWVDRNSLDNYWISISYKCPGKRLPTDVNEAFNIAGVFFALDENRVLNVYDAANEEWLMDSTAIPDDWFVITIHRDHLAKTADVYVGQRLAFSSVHVSEPRQPSAKAGQTFEKFRMSLSSVGEFDAFFDFFSALPYSPF